MRKIKKATYKKWIVWSGWGLYQAHQHVFDTRALARYWAKNNSPEGGRPYYINKIEYKVVD